MKKSSRPFFLSEVMIALAFLSIIFVSVGTYIHRYLESEEKNFCLMEAEFIKQDMMLRMLQKCSKCTSIEEIQQWKHNPFLKSYEIRSDPHRIITLLAKARIVKIESHETKQDAGGKKGFLIHFSIDCTRSPTWKNFVSPPTKYQFFFQEQ